MFTIITVKEGKGQKGISPEPFQMRKLSKCDLTVTISNGKLSKEIEDEDLVSNLFQVYNHLIKNARQLFKSDKIFTEITFSVLGTHIIMTGGSLIYERTRPKTACSNIGRGKTADLPKLDIKCRSIATSKLSERRSKVMSMRASTPQKTFGQPDIIAAIDEDISEPVAMNKCVSGTKKCGPVKYKFPRIIVTFYRVRAKFKSINDDVLYRMIENRMEDPAEQVAVCLHCHKMYLAAMRIWECSLIDFPECFDLEPRTFQPVVDAELEAKRDMPVGISFQSADPHSFALNVLSSPYKKPVPLPMKEPPLPERRQRPNTSTGPRQSWCERLSAVPPVRTARTELRVSKCLKAKNEPAQKLQEFQAAVTFSEKKAKRCYGSAPFDITKLEARRKKTLHDRINCE